MIESRTKHITEYLQKVKNANKEMTKKEAFKDLLNRLYANDKEIVKIIDSISSGAEKTIVNIPRLDKFHRGSADTLYNKIIIEFENDLKVSLRHAKEQLAGYLLGQFHSGEGYNFTLIASDFIHWKVFAPDISQIDILDTLTEDKLILKEVLSASFILTEQNIEDFYYWIDRFLFKEEKQTATLKRIEESFGYQSHVFIECYREMSTNFTEIKKFGEVQVSYEQWKKFLSIAYGSFDASERNFLIHTYLSVFSKMLAYSIISNDDYISDDEMKGIIDGSIFQTYNIRNFVDNDFFYWIKNNRSFVSLKNVFRLLAQEISTFDFHNVEEDVLKGVYQELIDLDTRHALGEYYTPDWLCEKIVNEYQFTTNDKILDPACGSGSFLRAAIHRVKELHPEVSVEKLNEHIFGIDIHPLSVQISKTTVLLALGKEIVNSKKPIHFNIILANTLLAPEGVESLFGRDFKMKIDKEEFLLNTQLLEEVDLFDEGLDVCDDLAELTMNKKSEDLNTFEIILKKKIPKKGFNGNITNGFYRIYLGLKSVKEKGRDSIWKFILQNIYKPYFLQRKFDYIIGNPPWFTYSSIKNEEYQNILNELAESYDVKPERKANFPHLEIAAIFLSHCSSYFLNDNGKIAFVLPRSFFSADHHENTRSGKSKGFKITEMWDVNKVTPLFRIPSCVIFADKSLGKRALPSTGIEGRICKGKLPEHNCNLKKASVFLSEETVYWYYIKQGRSTAFSNRKRKTQIRVNPYKKFFKQGATIVPRTFYFVELNQETPSDFDDRIISIITPKESLVVAKKPWVISFKGQIESRFLFYTAISKNILPFVLYEPSLVVLPIHIVYNKNKKRREVVIQSFNELRMEGYLKASKWFEDKDNIWNIHKTEKNKANTSVEYLNWQKKLTEQNIEAKYLVLYTSSAKDANATVLKRTDLQLEFIAESKTYVFYTDERDEAYYVAGILNSSITNTLIKDFQTRGLFGARDVHKKILDVYFPKFDNENNLHILLAEKSIELHKKAREFIEKHPPQSELTPFHLGRIRMAIKTHLATELNVFNEVVIKVIK